MESVFTFQLQACTCGSLCSSFLISASQEIRASGEGSPILTVGTANLLLGSSRPRVVRSVTESGAVCRRLKLALTEKSMRDASIQRREPRPLLFGQFVPRIPCLR